MLLGDIHIHKCPFHIFTQQNVYLLSPLLNCTCNHAICFRAQYILVGWKVDIKYKHLFKNGKNIHSVNFLNILHCNTHTFAFLNHVIHISCVA